MRSYLSYKPSIDVHFYQQLQPEVEIEDARMTTEQLKELAEALSVLSAQSSVLQERTELRALMEENLNTGEVRRMIMSIISIISNVSIGPKVTYHTIGEAHSHHAYTDRLPDVSV